MHTDMIKGRRVTDKAGAAEYLGMSIDTVRQYTKPSQRQRRGWPEPVQDGWFAIDDLDAFREATGRHSPRTEDDPDELLTAKQFAALRGVTHTTMIRYIHESEAAWMLGHDGLLPMPDATVKARHGQSHRWRRSQAQAWAIRDQQRQSTGRPAGPRPTIEDLNDIVAKAARRGDRLRGRDIAAQLTERYGAPVSLQTVHRLKAKLRASSARQA